MTFGRQRIMYVPKVDRFEVRVVQKEMINRKVIFTCEFCISPFLFKRIFLLSYTKEMSLDWKKHRILLAKICFDKQF